MAFFAATIDELQNELRPAGEAALARHGIPSSTILVNVGDNIRKGSDASAGNTELVLGSADTAARQWVGGGVCLMCDF